ncbi:MAG: fumarylacetoacetate hydrolase family protein [Planctomycetes bacterium]|nr:fumarylacetoacetate hydrolase family protein [Planctomycetota bacterium]MCB9887497.1 fumarylacetoacetate hydrolase family protein [Planctomycetota bacterium]
MTAAAAGLPAVPAWFRFERDGAVHVGAVDPAGPQWFDLGPLDVHALLEKGALRAADLAARMATAARMAAPERFAVPVPRPGKILCLAKNYVAHAKEMGGEAPAEPIFFAKLPDTLVAHGAPVVIPHWLTTRVDHEAELGLVLGFADAGGRGRKYVTAAQAPSLVAGFTVLNDVTARKLQGQDREHKYPWLRSKALDTFCPVGPFVVPADALEAGDLRVVMRVNGEVRQDARTSAMVFPIGAALAAMARCTTLRPGDLIAMGTPEGVGPVVAGDVMEVEVEGLGVLRNPVVAEDPAAAAETPPA